MPSEAPHKHDTVFPDGEDTYYCSWNPSTEWDVQKEQDLGVSYEEPGESPNGCSPGFHWPRRSLRRGPIRGYGCL
jgi:hypothetical protein